MKKSFFIYLLLVFLIGCSEDDNISGPDDLRSDFLVVISSPNPDSTFVKSTAIQFTGEAFDDEGDELAFDSLKWESSIDGRIGSSASASTYLSDGIHTITLSIYKDDQIGQASISLTVVDTTTPTTILENEMWKVFNLTEHQISNINFDNNGNALIATNGGGLFIQSGNSWKVYTEKDGLIDNQTQFSIADDQNNIYVANGFYSGIDVFNGTSWSRIELENYLGGDVHCMLFDDNNMLWAMTHNGKLVYYENSTWHLIDNQPKDFVHPYKLWQDDQGNFWGTSEWDGTFMYDNNGWNLLQYAGNDQFRFATTDDNGNVWASLGVGSDLYRFSESDTSVYSLASAGVIKHLTTDKKGQIWMAAGNQILKTEASNFSSIEIVLPDVSQDEDSVHIISVDHNNNIWFLKNNTIYVYKGDHL